MGLLTLATILMGVIVIFSIIAITYLYHYFNGLVDQQQSTISFLREEIGSVGADLGRLSDRIAKLEKNSETRNQLQPVKKEHDGKDKNIAKAKQLLNDGANLDIIIEECQLAQGEADLVRLANRMDRLASY